MATSTTRRDTLVRALRGARPDFTLTNARTVADQIMAAPENAFSMKPLTYGMRQGAAMRSSHAARARSAEEIGNNLDKVEAEIATKIVQESVKDQLLDIVSAARRTIELHRRGLESTPTASRSLGHMAFLGGPGTGKTTAARVVAEILHSAGLLRTNQVVEVGRNELVACYEGQTSQKVRAVVERAVGGVLIVDRPQELVGGRSRRNEDPFGREALAELIASMEKYAGELTVVFADYASTFEQLLIDEPGLGGHVGRYVTFPTPTVADIVTVVRRTASDHGRRMDLDGANLNESLGELTSAERTRAGNLRLGRNLVEAAEEQQARRLSRADPTTLSDEELITIVEADLRAAAEQVKAQLRHADVSVGSARP